MDEGVRIKLREILSSQGETLRRDPQRMEAILRDHCPEGRREIHMLVSAARAGIVEDLVGGWGAGPPEMLVARLSKRLHEDMGIAPPLARWTVESWAYALYNVRFRPRAEPRPVASPSAGGKTPPRGIPDQALAFLASIPRRLRDRKDPHRVHLLVGVTAVGVLLAAAGISLLSKLLGPGAAPPPPPAGRERRASARRVPGPASAGGPATDDQEGSGGEGPGAEEGGFTPTQAKELLKGQFPGEEFQVARVVHGSFTAPEIREAVFAVTSSGFSPMECRSRLWLASKEGGWHLVGEVVPKVTSVAQVVDVDRDGISEVLTSYSCTFRGVLEERWELLSLNNFPRSNLKSLFSVTESGSQPEGAGAAPPPIPYHEIRFREYPGEAGLVLRDEITDPVLKSRRCKNYHLREQAYALAEDLHDC